MRKNPLTHIPPGMTNFHDLWKIFRADGQASTSSGNKRLQQTQAQVNEVVGIMRVNVEKVLERDQKLSELDQRVSESSLSGAVFHGTELINQITCYTF